MKKKIIFITMLIVFLCTSAIMAVCSFTGIGRQFIIKNQHIKSAVVDLTKNFSVDDSEEAFTHKLNEIGAYFYANTFNTAIIPFNQEKQSIASVADFSNQYEQAEYLDNGDILKRVNKWFKKRDIQIILALDCSVLTDEEISSVINEINKKYYPAGILLENYLGSYETLQSTSRTINKKFKNYYFGINCDYNFAKPLAANNVMNLFVINSDMPDYSGNYVNWKNAEFAEETVLLTYESSSFLNDLFILYNFHNPDGYILTEYISPDESLNWYYNILDTTVELPKFNLSVDNSFAVTHPSKDIITYDNGIFVTGSADINQILYINGKEVAIAADGTFGIYLELEDGENRIEAVQGEKSVLRTVTKKNYEYSGDAYQQQWDNTKKAYKGQVVQTINALTSILSNPDDDSRIIDGLQQGVQMVVTEIVKTTRDGKYTWTYKLSNGGYVLAKNVEWVSSKEYIPAKLKDISIQPAEDGNEYMVLNVTGKPAVISNFKNSQVVFTFINTSLDKQYVEEDGEFFVTDVQGKFTTECYVKQDGKNTVLVMENNTENELWGYNIEYNEDDIIKIYLKKSPKKQAGPKPLTGVTVLLDAGHGGKDVGALGVGGVAGPNEKDINLAVSIATKECLERFGATVYLTRSDDTYLTLEERRIITNEIKPDLFISQHHNSLEYTVDATKASGFVSYYFTPQSANMAEIMADRVSDSTGRDNLGYGFGYYYVLRNDIAPCVLNEYGFVINPYEYSELYKDENIYKSAFGTALAVLDLIPE